MVNNTFKEIAEVLLKAEKILIYPHINADGDAVGRFGGGTLPYAQKAGKDGTRSD